MAAAQQIVGHGWDERARQGKRTDQREHDRLRHWREQIAGDAAELEHRHENDAQAQQRHKGRNNNLLRAVEDGRFDFFALFEMIINVLDRHRPVVDQNANGEREAAERHDVDGLAKPGEQGQREQDGKRNFDEDDDRRTPTAEEQQDHQADQRSGQNGFTDDPEDGGLHKDRLIAHRVQVETGGQALLNSRQQGLDAVDDGERRSRSGLENGHQHRARAVDSHEIRLRR